jgi:hypothetical protein
MLIFRKGQYNGVWVIGVDAKTGKNLRDPVLFKAGLGQKPENAEEAAILSAVAKGLGEVRPGAFQLSAVLLTVRWQRFSPRRQTHCAVHLRAERHLAV